MLLECSRGHRLDTADPDSRGLYLRPGCECPIWIETGNISKNWRRCRRVLKTPDDQAKQEDQRIRAESRRVKVSLTLDRESVEEIERVQDVVPGVGSDSAAVDHLIRLGAEKLRESG